MINELKLDLACGNNKREDFKGIDVVKTDSTDYVVDLQVFPWPIESESAEEVEISHYIEHIPHVDIKGIARDSNSFEEFKEKLINTNDGFINFFNELYRILKPGGKAHIVCPYYTSYRAFGDPTHTRYIGEASFYYLSKKWRDENSLSHYGFDCNFDFKASYYITNEMTLKSDEVRQKAFLNDWNAIEDVMIDLIKK